MKTNAETTQNEATTAAVAEQGAPSAPEQATSTKGASQKKGAPKAKKAVKKAKPAAKKAAKAAKKAPKTAAKPATTKPAGKKTAKAAAPKTDSQARDGSKKAIVIAMLTTKDGATLAAIMKATDWKKHSIRGFISGNLMKKMDLPVESFKNEAGERCYKIAK